MAQLTQSVNHFNDNSFKILLSNIPNLTGIPDKDFDFAALNNNIRGIQIPDLTGKSLESFYLHQRQIHPNPIGARDLNTVTLEILADDRMMNYYIFQCWLRGSRYGEAARTDLRQQPLLRDNCIDSLKVYCYDNAKNVVSKHSFNRAFIQSISTVNLKFGQANHVTFTVTLEYEEYTMNLQNRVDPGDEDKLIEDISR